MSSWGVVSQVSLSSKTRTAAVTDGASVATVWLSPQQVAEMFGVSQATIFRWLRDNPEFPRPLKLSAGCTRFSLVGLQIYVTSLEANDAR